jgi:hypothetical protein
MFSCVRISLALPIAFLALFTLGPMLAVDGYCRFAEPVNYVSEVQNRYDHYVQIVPMQ